MTQRRPSALQVEFLFDDEPAPSGPGPAREAPQGLLRMPGAAPRPGGATVRTVHQPVGAEAILAEFEAVRPDWYGAHLAPYVERIAAQLQAEAALSRQWQGLPGTDHPDAWASRGSQALRRQPAGQRLHVWYPEVWWMAPVVRRHDRPLQMRLPLAASADALVAELAAQVPPAWRHRSVVVQVEIETRIYWGGHAAAGGEGEAPWEVCSYRGDGVGFSEDLLQLKDGQPTWLAAREGASAPLIRRSLRAGVGLMVTVPVVTFELQPRPAAWLLRLAQRALAWLGLRRTPADRDPTFPGRLASEQAWWSGALGLAMPPEAELERDAKRGSRLDVASAPAARHRPGDDAPHGHVVLIHGGLSSVRSAFDALLQAEAASPAGQPGPVWPGLPELDACCTWRFEHDTFLRVQRNIDQLIDALDRQVIGRAPAGDLVLLSHSRGGNVIRFALDRLRQRWPQWRFHGLTVAAPHEGTPVFRRIGRRWSGVARLVGFVSEAAAGRLTPQQATDLALLERALAYDIPPGFRDLEPAGVARMARGRGLPEGLHTWGSLWRPAPPSHVIRNHIARVLEDWAGLEADGDGVVPRRSALAGLPTANDASPSFHTAYFQQPQTVAQIAAALRRLLSLPATTPAPAPVAVTQPG